MNLHAPTVPLDQIHPHAGNPRRHAVADEEMVDSIRSLGIAQALTIAPAVDGDGYTLMAGHRRLDGAQKAGLTAVPVMFRDDLVTEAQQLEFMLVENLHRQDLTAVEEAEAYEQLTFAGMDVDAIAKATGRKAATIKARLKLNDLAETSRQRLHAGEMTLLDADALLEFADDPDTTAKLEAAIGTSNFRWTLEDARRAKERKARRDAQIAELQTTGATEVEELRDGTQPSLFSFPDDLKAPEAHDGCLAYVVPASQWQDPYLVCTDPGRHPKPEKAPEVPSEPSAWEKAQAERAERRARQDAATAARIGWLRDHFTAMFPTKSHKDLAAAAKAFLPGMVSTGGEHLGNESLLTALGALPAPDGGTLAWNAHQQARTAYAAGIPAAGPTKVLEAFAAVLATMVADMLATEAEWFTEHDEILHQLALWDWMKAAGYELSDVDRETVTELEVKHTALAEAS